MSRLAVAVLMALAAPARATAVIVPCIAPDADEWVVDFRDRVLRYNALAAFAVAEWGDPVACDAQQTAEFDGARYGTLVLTFSGDVTLRVETQPIETSIVTLAAVSGFDDPTRSRRPSEPTSMVAGSRSTGTDPSGRRTAGRPRRPSVRVTPPRSTPTPRASASGTAGRTRSATRRRG